ncbi:MAG: hypothetical protein JWM28_272 [Chitinophagaceae bacterium]|nr:hypothetical protein [Chitinophagaceae bacterium]
MKSVITKFFFSYFLCSTIVSNASIALPKIFTDNMVLQRDHPLKVWGTAGKGETVTVNFNGQNVKSKADKNGSWIVTLAAMKFGGPFDLSVSAKSGNITFKNVLIGDVWICSGQSNMEWIIKNTNNAAKEMAESNYPAIRLFTVQKSTAYIPQTDFAGGEWLECSPKNTGEFSAVAYFFGRKLNKDMGVPIGLINTSWGGTNIQTWISWDIMGKEDAYKNIDLATYEASAKNAAQNQQKFLDAMHHDKGLEEKWYEPSTSLSGWKTTKLPQAWENGEIGNEDGIVWFRKEFELPDGKSATLNLGPVDDMDSTFINGKLVGSTDEWNKDRVYSIDATVLHSGKNVIVVKVRDDAGGGGIYGKPEQLFIEVDGKKFSLAGEWLYKPSVLTTGFDIKNTGPNAVPSQLYNAMIAPMIQYAIKGGIWYQGESNTHEAFKYRTLFANLIADWRSKWKDSFSFLWVQLANFMQPVATPAESDWAELREAQNRTLTLPQTGQAVIIDIGEAGDIHPRNKQDVGYRLALAAEKTSYGKDIVYSGPVYQSMKTEGNKIVLSFTNTGSGLMAKDKYGYLKGFTMAGKDRKFVWAGAVMDGDKIIVFSDAVTDPVAVRYAWANNPDDANLYNKEGLPASPFRTDDWKGITEK